ncbi:MAG: iron-containing alcohol dehydrogenase [Clostridia bacterium]|nr:iron-containing alcohol dehydrogenase [Clostridia bacterium]
MVNFEYFTPTRIIFGKDVIKKLPEVITPLGKRVLLTYGSGSIKRNGLYDKVIELLKGFEIYELSGIEPNPKYSTSVVSGVKICKENNIDVILAVGGGSVLDCSKAIAAGAKYDGETWNLIIGKAPTLAALPIVDIITMAATGSEYDSFGVISRTETNDKLGYSSEHVFPVASFIDPTYTFSVPKRQMLAGVADAMNHIFEQYFNSEPNGLADGMMESSLRSLIKNVKIAVDDPENYDVRAEIFLNCTLACNGILSIGEEYSGWPMHAMEHALSAYYDITHGIGLAILTPRWMRHILNGKTEGRIAQYGINVLGIDQMLPTRKAAEKTIDETYALYESLGIPMHLKDVGIDEKRLGEMARHVLETKDLDETRNYFPLTEQDVLDIYKACL